jgi:uncharacterized protein (DUF2164 family)
MTDLAETVKQMRQDLVTKTLQAAAAEAQKQKLEPPSGEYYYDAGWNDACAAVEAAILALQAKP